VVNSPVEALSQQFGCGQSLLSWAFVQAPGAQFGRFAQLVYSMTQALDLMIGHSSTFFAA
jgi:hypothetical protein